MIPGRGIILNPISYSDIFGSKPTLEELNTLVQVPEWKLISSRCIGIAAISWKDGVEDPVHQEALARDFARPLLYGPALESRLHADSRARLYTRESLLAVLRIAVVHHTEPGATLSDLAFCDIFHKSILMANELIVDELTPPEITSSPQDLLATELRSMLARQPNVNELIARTAALFAWSESARGRMYGAWPLRADFERFTGLTPEEYAAAAYLVLARQASLRSWDDVAFHGPAFDPEKWLAGQGVLNKRVPITWLERHTVSIDSVRYAWARETSLSFAGAGPLWKTPIVRDEEGLLFMPSPFFVTNALGDGAYFELFDGYGRRNTDFSALYGHFFQDYVEDRFRAGYQGRSDVHIWADVPYSRGQSTDVIISEAKHVIFVEIVAKRMQLVGSVRQLDDSIIAEDLRMGVIEKLEQLHANIDAYRAGTLLPEIPRAPGQRLYPVLVAPREWPRIYLLRHLLKISPYDMLLPECEPIEFLTLGEVEDLEGRLLVGLRLAELLDRKNRSVPGNRALSLWNFLVLMEPGTCPINSVPTRIRGQELARSLIELARSWTQGRGGI